MTGRTSSEPPMNVNGGGSATIEGAIAARASMGPASTPVVHSAKRSLSPSLQNTELFNAIEKNIHSSGLGLRQRVSVLNDNNGSNETHSTIEWKKDQLSGKPIQSVSDVSGMKRVEASSMIGEEVNLAMLRWGWALLIGSTLAFVLGFWSIAIGPFLNTKGIFVLDVIAEDTHFKYLLVFLIPVTLYAVIINWWGLKIFRHA